ncbi:MAG: DMT family transporter [SAR324 cluster bacterium]|nr:DMT family transporter [SAR324 cluster bacterium]
MIEIHISVLLFGFSGLFGKFLSLAPLLIVLGRTFFASVILLLVLRFFKQTLTVRTKADFWIFAGLGGLLAIHWLTFFHSIQLSTVAIGLITYSTFPIFVTFLEPVFFKEKIRALDILTSISVFVGVFLVLPSFDLNNRIAQGVFWGIAAGFTFAVLSLLNRKYVRNYPPLVIASYQNIFATLVFIPLSLFQTWDIKTSDIFLLIMLGVFCTAGAHLLFIKGLVHIKTQLASIIASLEPVYGIIFAFILLGEFPSMRTLSGGLIIIGTTVGATMLSNASKRQAKNEEIDN